jgi:hypothetical protein
MPSPLVFLHCLESINGNSRIENDCLPPFRKVRERRGARCIAHNGEIKAGPRAMAHAAFLVACFCPAAAFVAVLS